MLTRISHTQIRVFHVTNLCFQPDRVCLYVGTLNTLSFEKKLKKKYLLYETKTLTNGSNITYFVGKVTFMPQDPKPNPDAYAITTKLMFEENLL